MADWGSESSSSTVLAFSDTDIETINTEELVIFDSTQTFYSTKKDIVVTYTSGNAVENTPKDWVGMFKSGWKTIYDFSAYQWVPLDPISAWESRRRRSIFPQADIEFLVGDFQFVYVTGDYQVIGVSEGFQLSDFIPKSYSSLFASDTLPQSLSLISLGSSSSSSSEENECDEETPEEKKCASEQVSSKPVVTEPQVTTVSIPNDNWTLSDFVIANNSGTLYEKLRFTETFDPKEFVNEFEPLKQIYHSLHKRQMKLVEEIGTDKSDLVPVLAGDEVVSLDVAAYDKPVVKTLVPSVRSPSISPVMHSFWREHFRRSCLEFYRQKLMEPTLKENAAGVPTSDIADNAQRHSNEKPKVDLEQFPRWILPMSSLLEAADGTNDRQEDKVVSPFAVHWLQPGKSQTPPALIFFRRKAEENNETAVTGSAIGSAGAAAVALSDPTPKEMVGPVFSRNLRKKRSVKSSRSQASRGNRDAMLQEALALLTTQQNHAAHSAAHSAAYTESAFSGAAASARARNRPGSRKRPSKTTTSIDKAKRRRLGSGTSASGSDPCNTDDGGYFSSDDEDGGETASTTETLALLSQALSEALESNAELRLQLRRAREKRVTETKKCNAASNTTEVVKKDTSSQYAKSASTGKAVHTEKRTKCNAAANTATVAKKDTPTQCSTKKTKGKATNTDKKEKRHASSNTAVVTKKDTHSQCVAPKTTGKSTNTSPLPSNTDLENDTNPVRKTDTSAQCKCNKTDSGVKTTQSDPAALSLALRNSATPRREPESETRSCPNVSQDKWKTVASKKMFRLRLMIAKKREEFARVKENAENYEKRAQTLEAQLRSVRAALSAETSGRLKAEQELRELRIKFWELLAARKSKIWTTPSRTYGALDKSPEDLKPLSAKPVTLTEPFLFKAPDILPVKATSEVNNEHTLLTRLPDSGEVFPGMAIKFTASTDGPYTANNVEKKSSESSAKQNSSGKTQIAEEEKIARCAEVLPLVSSAQFKNVPVKAEEVKRASSSAISFKKFLMPAMTAIAETFSSKSRHKLVASDEQVTLTTTTKSPDSKPSGGAVAHVTVAISAGIPSSKSSPTLQKTESKSRKSKRSSSKGKTKAENCKPPKEETSAEISSDVTLRRKPETAPCKPKTSEKATTKMSNSSSERATPRPKEPKSVEKFTLEVKSSAAAKRVEEVLEKADEETAEWSPLVIPFEVCAESDDSHKCSHVTGVQPVKFRFDAKHKSAGKGRPFSYGNAAAGRSCLRISMHVCFV